MIDFWGDEWIEADKPISQYPIGTRAKAVGGGYWERVELGWKWALGSTFPSVGGDWSGKVCLDHVKTKKQ